MSIKLKGSSDGSVSLDAPADTSPSGTDVSFTLPTQDGTAGQVLSTNGSGGLSLADALTEFDQFILRTDVTADGTITDFQRPALPLNASQIGTGMSVSSGIFSFPRTGKYLIIGSWQMDVEPDDSMGVKTDVSSDSGSTYAMYARVFDGHVGGTGQERRAHCNSYAFIDVTNVSTFRVKFHLTSVAAGGALVSDTHAETTVMFIRLGDSGS